MFLLAVTKFKVNTTQYAGIGHHIIYLVPINMNTLLLASKLNQADASTSWQLSYSSMLQAFVHWETKEQFSYSPPHSLAVHLQMVFMLPHDCHNSLFQYIAIVPFNDQPWE